jgi:hypothetical protein
MHLAFPVAFSRHHGMQSVDFDTDDGFYAATPGPAVSSQSVANFSALQAR